MLSRSPGTPSPDSSTACARRPLQCLRRQPHWVGRQSLSLSRPVRAMFLLQSRLRSQRTTVDRARPRAMRRERTEEIFVRPAYDDRRTLMQVREAKPEMAAVAALRLHGVEQRRTTAL